MLSHLNGPEPKKSQALSAARDHRYHRQRALALTSEEDALAFVEEVGFCFLFPVHGLELPSLWEAINGGSRPLPDHFNDRALDLTWEWKDTLPSRRLIYYGKLLKRKPTLAALDLLPHFYALSENCGDPDEYLDHYRDGKLSEEAKRIHEALLEHGPQPTSRLRVLAGLPAQQGVARFERAIAELQAGLYIVKSGISDANAWKYCYVYDLLPRRFPEVVAGAAHIPGKQARRTLALRYLRTVIAAGVADLARLFDWSPALAEQVMAGLLADGLVEEAAVPGARGPWLRAVALDGGGRS